MYFLSTLYSLLEENEMDIKELNKELFNMFDDIINVFNSVVDVIEYIMCELEWSLGPRDNVDLELVKNNLYQYAEYRCYNGSC